MPNHQSITRAINHWNTNTRFSFFPRTTEHDFVEFTTAAGSCSSRIGRVGGRQTIGCALGSGFGEGSVIHEMGHAVGFFHEQSREDRNFFVTVHFDNVIPAQRGNFDQAVDFSDDVGPYDYGSIMHYGNRGFAIDPGKDTISAPQTIGQRNALSRFDIVGANSMLLQKTVLGDTSTSGPSLITFQNRLIMAWRGVGNNQLNVIQSADGHHWNFKVTLGDTTLSAPALGVVNGHIALAWRGVGNNQLNILLSADGVNWTNKLTLGDTSRSGLGLANFQGHLYLTWRGVNNNQLNTIRSTDGISWGDKRTLGDTTTSGPSLTGFADRLLLVWRGVGNNFLNVLQSADGLNFGSKVTLGDTTLSSPKIHAFSGRAYLTWQGVGNNLLNILGSHNGVNWQSKITLSDTSLDGPVISSLGDRVVWGWTGTDSAHHLNCMLPPA